MGDDGMNDKQIIERLTQEIEELTKSKQTIKSTLLEMIVCARSNGYSSHAQGIEEAVDRLIEAGLIEPHK